MNRPSILISGASIAGPTAASWLAAAGWDVTVVERSDHLRDEGQNVDVRGLGREVLVLRHGHPRVEWHRSLLRTGLRALSGVSASPLGRALHRVRALVPAPPTDTITLPDYPARTSVGA